jgi:hypothetical protein
VAEPGPRVVRSRSPVSRWLSRVDELASRPLTVLLVVGAAVVWIVVSLAAGFPPRWETVFQTLVAAVTLALTAVAADQLPTARASCALVIFERPLTPRRLASA